MKKQIIKLTKRNNYSYCVTIPKEMIDKYGWKAKQRLTASDKGRGVIEIKDYRTKK